MILVNLVTVIDERDGELVVRCADGMTFDEHDYSMFKYGDRVIGELYGRYLARELLRRYGAVYRDGTPITVTASAYRTLTTAAQCVANGVLKELQWQKYDAVAGRIHRGRLTEGDYATMSHEERCFWMSQNQLTADAALIEGRHVIVVDDIRITGAHEEAVHRLLEDMNPRTLTQLYAVRLNAALAMRNPEIENRLNHAAISGSEDLLRLINCADDYVFTARSVKYIIARPAAELKAFLRLLKCDWLQRVYVGCLGDGYDDMETYRQGVLLIRDECERRREAVLAGQDNGGEMEFNVDLWLTWSPPLASVATQSIETIQSPKEEVVQS